MIAPLCIELTARTRDCAHALGALRVACASFARARPCANVCVYVYDVYNARRQLPLLLLWLLLLLTQPECKVQTTRLEATLAHMQGWHGPTLRDNAMALQRWERCNGPITAAAGLLMALHPPDSSGPTTAGFLVALHLQ